MGYWSGSPNHTYTGWVLILLPPSEGKTDPGSSGGKGRRPAPLDLASLRAPSLLPVRQLVAEALVTECHSALSNPAQLATVRKNLGLSASMDHELVRNAELFEAPAYAAYKVYTGVLFAAADFGSLSAAQRRVANSRVLVASALFGLVALNDKIPPYRLNADAKLPTLPGMASRLGLTSQPGKSIRPMKTVWRAELDSRMPELRANKEVPGGLIVDMRSGAYAAMWPIPTELRDQAITVKVWQRGPGNTKTAVSHFNKATKGELARLLATVTPAPRDFEELINVCTLNSWDVQLNLAGRPQLDVLIEP